MSKVSINIITYNREKMLERAIERILMQDFKDYEIIIVDDCSSDNTDALVKKYSDSGLNIKYHKNQTHRGISISRNHAVAMSSGQYIAVLDSDDFWIEKDKLSKQVVFLDSNPDVGMIGTSIAIVDESGWKKSEDRFATGDEIIRKKLLLKNQFAQSSIMFRKEIFNKVGGYDTELEVCEDYDLWLKIGNVSRFANLPDMATAYTIHTDGISSSKRSEIVAISDKLIEKYKNYYPNYILAKTKSVLRKIIYKLL